MKYVLLGALLFGFPMALLWSIIFNNVLGLAGIVVGVVFGISFALCGGLLGYSIKKSKEKR